MAKTSALRKEKKSMDPVVIEKIIKSEKDKAKNTGGYNTDIGNILSSPNKKNSSGSNIYDFNDNLKPKLPETEEEDEKDKKSENYENDEEEEDYSNILPYTSNNEVEDEEDQKNEGDDSNNLPFNDNEVDEESEESPSSVNNEFEQASGLRDDKQLDSNQGENTEENNETDETADAYSQFPGNFGGDNMENMQNARFKATQNVARNIVANQAKQALKSSIKKWVIFTAAPALGAAFMAILPALLVLVTGLIITVMFMYTLPIIKYSVTHPGRAWDYMTGDYDGLIKSFFED